LFKFPPSELFEMDEEDIRFWKAEADMIMSSIEKASKGRRR
jgi:hypothetical protein